MQSARNELPAGRVLTITADAASSGSVRRLPASGSPTQFAAAAITASSTTVIGPFSTNRNYEVLSATGVLTYAITEGEPTATSAGLAGSLSDETGTGAAVFATSPTLVTPVLGVAAATSVNKVAITAPATAATLTIADGATLTVSASATVSSGTHSGTNTGDQDLSSYAPLASPTLTGTPAISAATGTSLAVTAGLTSSGPTGAGIGYATGAGGEVTQITDATTGVTLNKLSGQITTVSLDQAAGVDFSFTLTNSTIAAGDVVVASINSYGGTADGIPVVSVAATAAGSCVLNVRNTGAVTLDALAVINFAVIKAVAA